MGWGKGENSANGFCEGRDEQKGIVFNMVRVCASEEKGDMIRTLAG